ncbi:MAG: SpoIID/LytB domain-containing protein [Clostridiales bacterium]|nr:SpoIID/LytB domain-containing protein [Clostridiales bacterium]
MKKFIRHIALLTALILLPLSFPARAETLNGVVRVLLTKLNLTDQVKIALDGSYTLNDLSFQRGSQLTVSCASGTLMVYYEGMALDAGTKLVLTRRQAEEGKENGLRFNGAYELHPGDLYLTIKNGQLRAVLHAPVEEYLLGVVPYEMSDSFPLEALKAQAIAARTYALSKVGSNDDYDLVDNTNDQAYNGVKAAHENAAKAVAETQGICGYYKGKMAMCYYSASNGGQTELVAHVWGRSGEDGYLIMADDPYDLENAESVVKSFAFPKAASESSFLGALEEKVLFALSEALEAKGYDGDIQNIRITGVQNAKVSLPMYTDSPSRLMTLLTLSLSVQARQMLLQSDEEEVSIFAQPTQAPQPSQKEQWGPLKALDEPIEISLDLFPDVESALNLSINGGSNEIFSIRETEDAFILESRRYGHGVGMSQRGAQCMARDYEWTYTQILRFYYPRMELKTLSYSFRLPAALSQQFLATPGPAATPTPRPTPVLLSATPGPNEYKVAVTNIGVNSYLNMRAEPNTASAVLRQLYYNQELIVTQEMGEWLQVKMNDITGYVMASFVEKPLSATPAPN